MPIRSDQNKVANHPLKGFWLQRSFQKGQNPFQSIMDFPLELAVELNRRLSNHGFSNDEEPTRSENFIRVRQRIEAMLLSEAQKLGVQPENNIPLYFTVENILPSFPEGSPYRAICVPAELVPAHLITFSYDDTFQHHLRREGFDIGFAHRLHGRTLNARQTAAAIKKHGLPSDFIKQGARVHRYIEAQVWTRQIQGYKVVRPSSERGQRKSEKPVSLPS